MSITGFIARRIPGQINPFREGQNLSPRNLLGQRCLLNLHAPALALRRGLQHGGNRADNAHVTPLQLRRQGTDPHALRTPATHTGHQRGQAQHGQDGSRYQEGRLMRALSELLNDLLSAWLNSGRSTTGQPAQGQKTGQQPQHCHTQHDLVAQQRPQARLHDLPGRARNAGQQQRRP